MQIRTLSRTNSCLLACMSLVKALIAREPAAGYVCDIATNIRGYRLDDLKQLIEDASRQGLRNTLLLGLRSASLLFGVQVQFANDVDESILKDTSDPNLFMMILRPSSTKARWIGAKMLWDLCDDKKSYLHEMFWKIGAELCRRFYPHRVAFDRK
jgi:hypothetical protein